MIGLTAGARVRLLGDPGRIGVLTGQTHSRGGRIYWQAQFPELMRWVPAEQLESLPEKLEHPLDLFRLGRFSEARELWRSLAHIRLSGRQADVIYSMGATQTDFYAYQFKPVLKLLRSPANAVLIADEVGLGKTIEAGLVWTELRHRYDMRRLLVVCPAALREKWCAELSLRMGVNAEILAAGELLRRLKQDRSVPFAAVASLQGLRPGRDWESCEDPGVPAQLARYLQSAENGEPLIDLLVVDEAHHLRNEATVSHQIGSLLRRVSEFALLLTATPIHNRNTDLFSLFKLLDPGLLPRFEDFQSLLLSNRPLVEAREKVLKGDPLDEVLELLEQARADRLFDGNRQLEQLIHGIRTGENPAKFEDRSRIAYRLDTMNLVGNVINRTRKRDVTAWRVVREPHAVPVRLSETEQNFYDVVTAIVARYALTVDMNERFLLATPQRQLTSSMAAALRTWLAREPDPDRRDEWDESLSDEEIGPVTAQIIQSCRGKFSFEELREVDSKYSYLREIVQNRIKGTKEKLIVFSTFRPTLKYLAERLAEDGISSIVLIGGGNRTKADVINDFKASNGPSVLLSSEVGGEGVDLQFCSLLVNYDLPWNPMRVEQRIGRVDRLGQESDKVTILNLFFEDTIDDRIYRRLYEKLDLCRQALGDFEAILGDEMRRLTSDLLSAGLSAEQQAARIAQTAQALENVKRENESLEADAASLMAHGDYVLNQIESARADHRFITSSDLIAYVREGLNSFYIGCSIQRVAGEEYVFDVSLTPEAKEDLAELIRKDSLDSSTGFLRTSPSVRCWFENRVIERVRGAELVSQTHPLVRLIARRITRSDRQIQPAVAVRLPAVSLERAKAGIYVLSMSLWATEGPRATEHVAFAGCSIDSGLAPLPETEAERYCQQAIVSGQEWLEAAAGGYVLARATEAAEALYCEMDVRFAQWAEAIVAAASDRADLLDRMLSDHHASQRSRLMELMQKHQEAGRIGLSRATEGRIRALQERVARRRIAIGLQRQSMPVQTDIGLVLLHIY